MSEGMETTAAGATGKKEGTLLRRSEGIASLLRELKHPMESFTRTSARATSWRITVAVAITPVLTYSYTHFSYMLSHKKEMIALYSLTELAVKLPLQSLHDHLWSRISWGIVSH